VRLGNGAGFVYRLTVDPAMPLYWVSAGAAALVDRRNSRALPVLMESEPGFSLVALMRFLDANRHLLRSKTL
jgi:hypothetical protein